MLSIIIPTYNSGEKLSACLDSIVSQTYTSIEVWIIDGLSADSTTEIVKRYQSQHPYIHFISEKDKGIYDAMNKGIDKAQGEWLYFLGSDDELYDNRVLETVFKQVAPGEADFAYGNVWFLKHQSKFRGECSRLQLSEETNISHQAIFYKKALFEKLGKYNLQFKLWADWDFNVRCFAHPDVRIKYIDLIIARYNDFDGHSARLVKDEEFAKYLPLKRREREIINKIEKFSVDYRIGHRILMPFRWAKSNINKCYRSLYHRTSRVFMKIL